MTAGFKGLGWRHLTQALRRGRWIKSDGCLLGQKRKERFHPRGCQCHLGVFLTFFRSLGRWAGLLCLAYTVTCSQSVEVIEEPSGGSEAA